MVKQYFQSRFGFGVNSLAFNEDVSLLNELKYVNGFYRACNCLNMPPTSHGWAYVEVLVHNPLYWVVQTAIDLHDSTKRYTRHLAEGTWTQWREL